MTKRLITTADLHEAATLTAMAGGFGDADFEEHAVWDFIESSVFHPPLDETALAYGILVGRISVLVRDANPERNGDSGE